MTPLAVVFRAEALDDLAEISDFISGTDPAAASRVIQRIHATIFKTLAQFPMAGRLDPETGAREFPVPNLPYIVIFLPLDDVLDVVGIFHTSRDPTTKPRP
jgi:plasmid stabilization system protein ParE